MNSPQPLPRILVIDDFFGRQVLQGVNQDRVVLCEKFGLVDVSSQGAVSTPLLEDPCAEAVFFRGQVPDPAKPGDSVRNDLPSSVEMAVRGWRDGEAGPRPWAMVVLDLMFYTGTVTDTSECQGRGMPEGAPSDDRPDSYFGLQILRGIREIDPDLPVVILSSKSREDVSRTFSELGASGFIERDSVDAADRFRDHLSRHGLVPDRRLIGRSRALLAALRRARLLADGEGSILIRGEPGVGKELLARFIHDSSRRAGGAFVVLSLASVPRELAESELFGHSKGAFTGAAAARAGAFEAASGGTLFLDEIGDASADLQAKMLRVLESGVLQRVGSDERLAVDVRVISATNIDIEDRAARGEGFRADLLARLRQAGTVTLPPLRDRAEDIPQLAMHFVRMAERTHGRAMAREMLPETSTLLCRQSWPGNVRELRNCVSQAVYQHPDVEFLAPAHVQALLEMDTAVSRGMHLPGSVLDSPESALSGLCAAMKAYRPEAAEEWSGALASAQAASLRLCAALALAAIRHTKRPSVHHPAGEVLIHPAMKMLTGNAKLTATQAADLVKRLLGAVQPKDLAESDREDHAAALAVAQRLRPVGSRKAGT